MVEADVARNKVEVAKAQVRAVMAEIAAGEAEVQVIDAEIQIAMSKAEKATLQAQVAMIFAEIVTKKLAQVHLEVEKEEIAAAFEWVQMKLTDMLAMWAERKAIEVILERAAEILEGDVATLLIAEEAGEDLKIHAAHDEEDVFDYKKASTLEELTEEKSLREDIANERIDLQDAQRKAVISKSNKKLWAEELLNAAKRWVYINRHHLSTAQHKQTLYITGK